MRNVVDGIKGVTPIDRGGETLESVGQGADGCDAAGGRNGGSAPGSRTMTVRTRQTVRARLASFLRRSGGPNVPPALVSPDSIDPWDEFRRELNRSRRYERTFVLLRLPCRAAPYQEMLQVGAFLRSVDRAWIADQSVYVLLPESDRAMGEAFVIRIRRLAPEVLPAEGVRLAAFPVDGSTSGSLLAKLRGEPLAGTPRDVATMRAPHLRQVQLQPEPPVDAG